MATLYSKGAVWELVAAPINQYTQRLSSGMLLLKSYRDVVNLWRTRTSAELTFMGLGVHTCIPSSNIHEIMPICGEREDGLLGLFTCLPFFCREHKWHMGTIIGCVLPLFRWFWGLT
jgi:hypothetical protein